MNLVDDAGQPITPANRLTYNEPDLSLLDNLVTLVAPVYEAVPSPANGGTYKRLIVAAGEELTRREYFARIGVAAPEGVTSTPGFHTLTNVNTGSVFTITGPNLDTVDKVEVYFATGAMASCTLSARTSTSITCTLQAFAGGPLAIRSVWAVVGGLDHMLWGRV